MPIVPGGGDRWAGRRALESAIAQALAVDFSDDDVRRVLGKEFDFVVSAAARLMVAERKAVSVYDAIFGTIAARLAAGESVDVRGLGLFARSESAGVGAGAVIPQEVGGGPLIGDMVLVNERQDAEILPGNWAGGSAGSYVFVNADPVGVPLYENYCWPIATAQYSSPVVPQSGPSVPGWWRTSAGRQRVKINCTGAGDRFYMVGGLPVVEFGTVERVIDNVNNYYWMTVLPSDIGDYWAKFAPDYLAKFVGYWVPIGVDNLPMMQARRAEHWRYQELYGLTAEQIAAGFPRVVKRVKRPGPGGAFSYSDVEWLSGDEFRERWKYSKAYLVSQGYAWPEVPAARNRNTRITCSFADSLKAAILET